MVSICNYDIDNIRMYVIHRNTSFLNRNKNKSILKTSIVIYYLIVPIYLKYLNIIIVGTIN
jgi:hypothetical protein